VTEELLEALRKHVEAVSALAKMALSGYAVTDVLDDLLKANAELDAVLATDRPYRIVVPVWLLPQKLAELNALGVRVLNMTRRIGCHGHYELTLSCRQGTMKTEAESSSQQDRFNDAVQPIIDRTQRGEARVAKLESVLRGIQQMAAEDIRSGNVGGLTSQSEADARAALDLQPEPK